MSKNSYKTNKREVEQKLQLLTGFKNIIMNYHKNNKLMLRILYLHS